MNNKYIRIMKQSNKSSYWPQKQRQTNAPEEQLRGHKFCDKKQKPPLFSEGLNVGGAKRDRTADLLHAMQALSQLSYSPTT